MLSSVEKISVGGSEKTDIIELLDNISHVVTPRAEQFTPYTGLSLDRYLSLPEDKRRWAHHMLTQYLKVLESVKNQGVHWNLDEEISYAKSALGLFKLKLPDEGFFNRVAKNDIIEIYSYEAVQIYRNFEFFKYCGYDLLSLFSWQWPDLFDRPQKNAQEVFERLYWVMDNESKTVPHNVSPHTITEKRFQSQRVCSINMKYVCPLFSEETGKPDGFIHCVESDVVAAKGEAEKIHHI